MALTFVDKNGGGTSIRPCEEKLDAVTACRQVPAGVVLWPVTQMYKHAPHMNHTLATSHTY